MKYGQPRLLVALCLILLAAGAFGQSAPVHAAGFSFPALEVRNEWPREDFWKQISLPHALGAAAVSNVKTSFKHSIFPLKAQNDIMFSGNVDDKAFDQICDTLWESGYRGVAVENGRLVNAEDKSAVLTEDVDRVFYRAYYMHKGDLMHIEADKSTRGKLNLTIRYLPEL